MDVLAAPAAPISAPVVTSVPVVHQTETLVSAPVAARPATVAPAKVAPRKVTPRKVTPRKVAKKVTPKKKPAPKKVAARPVKTAPVSAYAQAMLDRINAERAQYGRAPLRMNGSLVASAHNHNLAMANANTMSHQLPGELALQGRLAAVGYNWSAAGENVGWNMDTSVGGMYNLDSQMMGEVAPNDGHRQNLLNTRYVEVGIDVYVDARTGKLWLTEDFGQPR